MITFSDPVEGRESEFNRWFNEVHIPEVLSVDGVREAARYRAGEQLPGRPRPEFGYAAVFVLETDDLKNTLASLVEAAATRFKRSDAVNPDRRRTVIYEQISQSCDGCA